MKHIFDELGGNEGYLVAVSYTHLDVYKRQGIGITPFPISKGWCDMENLTPRQIVEELDKYIVGQTKAKRAVAVALRNRLRRQKVLGDLQEDIVPKNILMIGPTGVGKTEIDVYKRQQ